VGHSTVKECLEKGLLHRAVAVLVVRSSGKLVLQQRSRHDRWQPGQWTLSSTGHVKKGERYGEAARRELFEELGMHASPRMLSKHLLPPISSGNLTEREWVTLYTARTDDRVRIDPIELDGVKEVSADELAGLMAGQFVTPDAAFLLRKYLDSKGQ
jgi:isopentenyldiphosphate isomerase